LHTDQFLDPFHQYVVPAVAHKLTLNLSAGRVAHAQGQVAITGNAMHGLGKCSNISFRLSLSQIRSGRIGDAVCRDGALRRFDRRHGRMPMLNG
jgi:hypothetical protein